MHTSKDRSRLIHLFQKIILLCVAFTIIFCIERHTNRHQTQILCVFNTYKNVLTRVILLYYYTHSSHTSLCVVGLHQFLSVSCRRWWYFWIWKRMSYFAVLRRRTFTASRWVTSVNQCLYVTSLCLTSVYEDNTWCCRRLKKK